MASPLVVLCLLLVGVSASPKQNVSEKELAKSKLTDQFLKEFRHAIMDNLEKSEGEFVYKTTLAAYDRLVAYLLETVPRPPRKEPRDTPLIKEIKASLDSFLREMEAKYKVKIGEKDRYMVDRAMQHLENSSEKVSMKKYLKKAYENILKKELRK